MAMAAEMPMMTGTMMISTRVNPVRPIESMPLRPISTTWKPPGLSLAWPPFSLHRFYSEKQLVNFTVSRTATGEEEETETVPAACHESGKWHATWWAGPADGSCGGDPGAAEP